MQVDDAVIRKAHAAFNARDIDAALALMQPHVDWPNGMEGGLIWRMDIDP